jgi:2,5-furandicarboxylate decarboxylase 1
MRPYRLAIDRERGFSAHNGGAAVAPGHLNMTDSQSMRGFLQKLAQRGELVTIDKLVDPRFELSAFLALADAGPALLFERVLGSDMPVMGNLLNSRARVAAALGVAPNQILQAIHRSIREPVKPVRVGPGPAQAVIHREAPLAGLPTPTFFEREQRPYITAGVILARDPETGRGNASFARLAILNDETAMIGIAPNHHLAVFARRAIERGRVLEIAVVIGADPCIQLAACLYLGIGDDELECAGALLGEPVLVTRAQTVDLDVPVGAEVILEGTIDWANPIEEGLVSEYHGMYESYGSGCLATFYARSQRSDAIFQAIEPGFHREHIYLGALPIAAGLLNAVAAVVPCVRDVAVTEAGGGRTDVVVQLDQPRPGQARRAMFAVFAAVSIVKRVTVVDADIDPWNPAAVEWARVSRMRLERDILLIPGAGADRSEPMEEGGMVTKIGFDATARVGDRAEGVERALPPPAITEASRLWLQTHLPAERRTWLD